MTQIQMAGYRRALRIAQVVFMAVSLSGTAIAATLVTVALTQLYEHDQQVRALDLGAAIALK